MSFSAPNQRFCEVNLSFGLSRRNFMSLTEPGRARQSPLEPAEPVEELPPLQKSYRACRKATGAQRSPREADTSHGLLLCYQPVRI